MPRNLDNRSEEIAAVYDPDIKEEMMGIGKYALRGVKQGRTVDGTGANSAWTCAEPLETGSQLALYRHYEELEAKEREYDAGMA